MLSRMRCLTSVSSLLGLVVLACSGTTTNATSVGGAPAVTTAGGNSAAGGTTNVNTTATGGTTASSTTAKGGTTASSTTAKGGTTASSTTARGGNTAAGGNTSSPNTARGGTSSVSTTAQGGNTSSGGTSSVGGNATGGNAAVNCSGTGWKLSWSDEFNGASGTKPDVATWTYDLGNQNGGWGNSELEYYTDTVSNVGMDGNGNLVITARKESMGGMNYTSTRMKTQGLKTFQYGRIEGRMQIPKGQGLWPAFWMLGNDIATNNWPACGEIDIMENIGKEPNIIHGSAHGPGYSGGNPLTAQITLAQPVSSAFHIFAVEWDATSIRWYVDDTLYSTKTTADLPSSQPGSIRTRSLSSSMWPWVEPGPEVPTPPLRFRSRWWWTTSAIARRHRRPVIGSPSSSPPPPAPEIHHRISVTHSYYPPVQGCWHRPVSNHQLDPEPQCDCQSRR